MQDHRLGTGATLPPARIKVMIRQAQNTTEQAIKTQFPSAPNRAIIAAIEAFRSLQLAHNRLAKIQMLATASGDGVFKQTEDIVAEMTSDMGGLDIVRIPPKS